MKHLHILLLYIMAVAANVCQNDTQAAGSPLSGSFGIAGVTLLYFLDILEDQDNELLYFIGYFGNPAPQDTIIYKSDPDLTKVQVMTYDIFCNYRSYAISPAKDFIYIQDWTTHKIFEVRTSDLVISRELAVSAASATLDSNMEIGKGFFFSLAFGSILHTCRWDMSSTNLDWFTLGVGSQINFAPVSEELLFFGSTDTAADQYYLMNYNFSSSSSLWKKSIACPTSGWVSKFSNSLLSRDEEWIYTMVLYDANFIFHKLSIADGSPQSSGLIWNDSGYYDSYWMKEFSDLVAIQIRSSSLLRIKRLILVTPSATEITKEYNSVDSSAYAVGKLLYKGEEMMYHSGRISTNDTFFFGRSPINNTGQLSEFEQDTPLFSPITTNYQVSPTTSNPSISTNTKTLMISTTSSITTTDITSSTNPSFNRYVALWNQDYSQIVQSNKLVKLEFTWAWAQSVNNTAITFSLAQTGSNAVPDWVQLDASSQELYLNATPKLAEEKNFYFLLQISFNSEVHYKKFEITVEEWSIQNCELWTLGSPSIWETWSDGYQRSDKKESCTKVVSISETKEVETKESKPVTETTVTQGLVISSIILASASSMLSLSSINSIFSIMNSLQLAILLPLIPDYFSPKVLAFLSEMGFTMLSFDFIKFKDIPFVEELTDWVSYPQSDGYLNSLGMRSGSSVVNYLSLMAIIILIGIINVGVFLWYRWTKNSKNRKWKKFTRKLFKFFTFNVYIRIFMQAFVFTTLSIFSELYNLNLDTIVTIVSFGVWVLFWLCTSVLFILSFIMYCKSFPTLNKVKYWPWIEYFNGVKPTKYSKLYSCMYMLMRVLLTSVIIFGQPTRQYDRATYFYLVNIAYCLYLIIVRPLENPQDNIIEIINQTLFCSLAVPLSWLDKKEAWTPFYEKFYTSVLMASPAIGSFIWLIFLIKSIVICIQKWKANNRQQDVAPKEPSSHIRASQHLNHHNPSPSPYINNRSSNMSRSNAPFAPPRDTQSRPYESSYPRRVQMTRKLDYRR